MTEADELASDLRAIYGEMKPYRNPDTMDIRDDVLALGVLLRREFRAAKPGSVANLRTRTLDRLAKHNSRDPE